MSGGASLTNVTRRELLGLGGAALAATALAPPGAYARYYVQIHSGLSIAAWESALKNYAPNLGYDMGGRLTAAWLERS